jgi:hypothetical protein
MDACACHDFVIKLGSRETGWLTRLPGVPRCSRSRGWHMRYAGALPDGNSNRFIKEGGE